MPNHLKSELAAMLKRRKKTKYLCNVKDKILREWGWAVINFQGRTESAAVIEKETEMVKSES